MAEESAYFLEPNDAETGRLAKAVNKAATTSFGSKLTAWAVSQYHDDKYEELEDYPDSTADILHITPVDRDSVLRNDLVAFAEGEDEDILRQVPEATNVSDSEIVDHVNYIVSEDRANGERTIEAPTRDSSKVYFNPTEDGLLEGIPSSRFDDVKPIDGSFRYLVLENAERGPGEGELRMNGFYEIESEGALLHDLLMTYEEDPHDVADALS